jgi:hypothetical protein
MRLLAGLLLMIPVALFGQAPATAPAHDAMAAAPTADQIVDRLVENSAVYRSTLPSLTVHETIRSETTEFVFFGSRAINAEATVRMVRKEADGGLEESRQFTKLNGKPVAEGQRVFLPLTIADDFNDEASSVFSAGRRHCFDFALSPRASSDAPFEMHIAIKPDAAELKHCPPDLNGLTGTARIDPVSMQLVHLERTIPDAVAVPKRTSPFFSEDYAPAKVGEQIFWLPTAVAATGMDGKHLLKWSSHYSDYHRYAATTKIVPVEPQGANE